MRFLTYYLFQVLRCVIFVIILIMPTWICQRSFSSWRHGDTVPLMDNKDGFSFLSRLKMTWFMPLFIRLDLVQTMIHICWKLLAMLLMECTVTLKIPTRFVDFWCFVRGLNWRFNIFVCNQIESIFFNMKSMPLYMYWNLY